MLENRAMYIIDENDRIVYVNDTLRQYDPAVQLHEKCYRTLAHREQSCLNCPLREKTQENTFYHAATKAWIHAETVKMEWENGKEYHAVFFRLLQKDDTTAAHCAHCKGMLDDLLAEKADTCILGQYCREGFPIFYAS